MTAPGSHWSDADREARWIALKMTCPACTLPGVRKSRSFRLALALALLLNVPGSPMAWSEWLGAGTMSHGMDTRMESAPCHDQESAHEGEPATAPAPMPCCDSGSCTCAAPALFIYVAATITRAPHPPFVAATDTSMLPANLLDDTLRPPIR
jgi:hypothetical protein